MNKKSREKLREIRAEYERISADLAIVQDKLEDLESSLDFLGSTEQFKLDNVPENLQNSEAYYDREQATSALVDVAADAMPITADCGNLVDSINSLLESIDDVES